MCQEYYLHFTNENLRLQNFLVSIQLVSRFGESDCKALAITTYRNSLLPQWSPPLSPSLASSGKPAMIFPCFVASRHWEGLCSKRLLPTLQLLAFLSDTHTWLHIRITGMRFCIRSVSSLVFVIQKTWWGGSEGRGRLCVRRGSPAIPGATDRASSLTPTQCTGVR